MATKPVTSPPIWASNTNWNTGPHTGQPAKVAPSAGEAQNGQVGGQTVKVQWGNYIDNLLTTWVATWLALGSAAGAEDAHIVETGSDGSTVVAQVTIPGRTGGTYGLQATGHPGAGPGTGVRGIGVGAAPGISGIGGNGAPAGSGDSYTGGFGVRGISGTATNASGVLGIGISTASLAANGVEGRGSLGGHGGLFTGGPSGHGIRAQVPAAGTGVAVDAIGEAVGVSATVIATANARAIRGTLPASSPSTAAGVYGDAGSTDGVGVWGRNVGTGYAIYAQGDTSNPDRAAFRLEPQDRDPATAQSGDIFYSDDNASGADADELRIYSRGAWRSAALVRFGYVRAFAANASTTTHSATGTWNQALTVSLAAPGEPRRTGTIWIRVTGEARREASGGTNNLQIRLNDTTAAAVISGSTKTVTLTDGATIWGRHFVYLIGYALPAAGARAIDLEITTTVNTEGVGVRDVSLEVYGVV